MKMNRTVKLFALIFSLLLTSLTLPAKQKPSRHQRHAWNQEMQSVKTDFISRKLELTQDQRDQFIPLYTRMESEIRKINEETRSLQEEIKKKGKSCTDLEYEKAAEAMFELKGKENAIELDHLNQFKKILTPRQLFELKDAEQEFTKELMKQHRKVSKTK